MVVFALRALDGRYYAGIRMQMVGGVCEIHRIYVTEIEKALHYTLLCQWGRLLCAKDLPQGKWEPVMVPQQQEPKLPLEVLEAT